MILRKLFYKNGDLRFTVIQFFSLFILDSTMMILFKKTKDKLIVK